MGRKELILLHWDLGKETEREALRTELRQAGNNHKNPWARSGKAHDLTGGNRLFPPVHIHTIHPPQHLCAYLFGDQKPKMCFQVNYTCLVERCTLLRGLSQMKACHLDTSRLLNLHFICLLLSDPAEPVQRDIPPRGNSHHLHPHSLFLLLLATPKNPPCQPEQSEHHHPITSPATNTQPRHSRLEPEGLFSVPKSSSTSPVLWHCRKTLGKRQGWLAPAAHQLSRLPKTRGSC